MWSAPYVPKRTLKYRTFAIIKSNVKRKTNKFMQSVSIPKKNICDVLSLYGTRELLTWLRQFIAQEYNEERKKLSAHR